MNNEKRKVHKLTIADKDSWVIRPNFHKLSYYKKKLVLEEMINWVEKMNITIDHEQH